MTKENEVYKLLIMYKKEAHGKKFSEQSKLTTLYTEEIVKLFAIPVVVVPKGTLCKCGKQYEVYNKLEGTIVCTLCGKDRLA